MFRISHFYLSILRVYPSGCAIRKHNNFCRIFWLRIKAEFGGCIPSINDGSGTELQSDICTHSGNVAKNIMYEIWKFLSDDTFDRKEQAQITIVRCRLVLHIPYIVKIDKILKYQAQPWIFKHILSNLSLIRPRPIFSTSMSPSYRELCLTSSMNVFSSVTAYAPLPWSRVKLNFSTDYQKRQDNIQLKIGRETTKDIVSIYDRIFSTKLLTVVLLAFVEISWITLTIKLQE